MNPTPREKHVEALQALAPSTSREDIVDRAESFKVHLGGPEGEYHPDDQVVLGGLINLLTRMYPSVHFEGPQDFIDGLPPSHRQRVSRGEPDDTDLAIIVGNGSSPEVDDQLFVGSEGWMAFISTEEPLPRVDADTRNPITALHAAALAAGETFKTAYEKDLPGIQPIQGSLRYDILRFQQVEEPIHAPRIPDVLHIEKALLVGVGAIGQAFLACLVHLPRLTGELRLVDPDANDHGNEQRCMFAYPENRGEPKVHVGRKALMARHGLLQVLTPTTTPSLITTYQGYRSLTGGEVPEPLVVTALDSAQARRDVQAGLPRVILDGWTEVQEGLLGYGMGRFTFGGDLGCLSCFHQPEPGRPEEAELAEAVTPFDLEECRRRLADPSIPTTREELAAIAQRTGREVGELAQLEGKPLKEVLHHQDCGLARMRVGEQNIRAPVTHMPVLAGTLLAAQFVVEVMGRRDATRLEHLCFFDARRPPGDHQLSERPPWNHCICRNPIFAEAYQNSWM